VAEDLKPMPFLRIVPNMGWNDGVNLRVVRPDITWAQIEDEDSDHRKYKATMSTLILSMRGKLAGHNQWYLGFIPEEAIFVAVPAWIFREEKS
jgi:hypothetical protein